MAWQAVLFKYRNGQIWQDECWFGEKPSCHFSCSRSTILMLIMLASFWWRFMSRRVVVMLPDRLVRCVLLIIFSLKLMILVCCWYTLQSDLHHELTAAEGCKENLRNRRGVGAIFFLLMSVYINCSQNQGIRSRFKGVDSIETCQRRSSPWLTPFSTIQRALKGQPTVNSEPWGIIFIRGTFPTAGSFVSTAAVVPPRWGRIFWWPTDCRAESSDEFVFIHKPSKCIVSFYQ